MSARERRAAGIAEFRRCALAIFQEQPKIRSILLALAHYRTEEQYWRERSDDPVRSLLVGSLREIPMWPHACGAPGESCRGCGLPADDVRLDTNAFAGFCHAHGDEHRSPSENYLPYAIARRAGDEIAIDVVGTLQRPQLDMVPDEHERPWLELPRARELYELVCANPGDDEARRVLADLLLEHEHPRGEWMALAGARGAAANARRAELLAQYGRQWIGPLGAVIPESGAHWERGVLTRADVFARGNADAVRGAAAWRTVETIRFLGGTDLIDPAMVALRDVGTVRDGLHDLARAPHPWAIERLVVDVGGDDSDLMNTLWRTATLPRLTHLGLRGPRAAFAVWLGTRVPTPWWRQLKRITVHMAPDHQGSVVRWLLNPGVWLDVAQVSAITDQPGWEFARGPDGQIEISLAGWHEAATPRALVDMMLSLPDAAMTLVPSRYWAPTAEDAAYFTEEVGRPVQLGAVR